VPRSSITKGSRVTKPIHQVIRCRYVLTPDYLVWFTGKLDRERGIGKGPDWDTPSGIGCTGGVAEGMVGGSLRLSCALTCGLIVEAQSELRQPDNLASAFIQIDDLSHLMHHR
jgi:hypothetical protein